LLLEVDAYDNVYSYYDKTPRKEYYKIAENKSYWESVQSHERQQTMELTDEQAAYINSQINSEFDPVEYSVEF
jgi:hypothetical protein